MGTSYIVGPPVLDPAHFFGRRRQIERFFRHVQGPFVVSLNVLGLHRSGITSFLRYVANPQIASALLPGTEPRVRIAYVDAQQIRSPGDFFREVTKAIARAFPPGSRPDVPTAAADSWAFQEWLEELASSYRLVVLVDEFEALVQSSEFDWRFFGHLRALAGQGGLAWVVASHRELSSLFTRLRVEEDLTSPFYNIFHPTPILLGALEPPEVEALVHGPAAAQGVQLAVEEVQAIGSIAGGLPYFLQATADRWLAVRATDDSVAQCYDKVLQQLLGPHHPVRAQLDAYWRLFTVRERSCLRQAASGNLGAGDRGEETQVLWEYGLLTKEEAQLKIAGDVFQRWILNFSPAETPVPQQQDAYSPYEHSLNELLQRIGQKHPHYSDLLTFQQRLNENIRQSRLHGDTDTRRAERSEVLDRLNKLALSTLGIPFGEL